MSGTLSDLKYHAAGLAAAAVTLLGLYPIIGVNINKTEIDSKLNNSKINDIQNYIAFSSDDYAGLSRIAAAKAVNRDSVVKAGFQASKICKEVEGSLTNKIPVQVGNLDPNTKHWTGQFLTTEKATTFLSACENSDAKTVIFTDSDTIRDKSKSSGVSPDLFAIGAFR